MMLFLFVMSGVWVYRSEEYCGWLAGLIMMSSSRTKTTTQIEPEWIVWSHGLVPALTVASRMAGEDGDAVMVR